MTRRIGQWTYGNHPGLNPGWRLDGTNHVLDFDPNDHSGSRRGAYVLSTDGRPGSPIDHFLRESMGWVERMVAK